MGAASIVIQVQQLISNRKALQPAPSWQGWEVELELVWEPERVGDRSLLTEKFVPAVQDWGDHAERREGRAVLGAAPQDLSRDPEFSGERLSCDKDT